MRVSAPAVHGAVALTGTHGDGSVTGPIWSVAGPTVTVEASHAVSPVDSSTVDAAGSLNLDLVGPGHAPHGDMDGRPVTGHGDPDQPADGSSIHGDSVTIHGCSTGDSTLDIPGGVSVEPSSGFFHFERLVCRVKPCAKALWTHGYGLCLLGM